MAADQRSLMTSLPLRHAKRGNGRGAQPSPPVDLSHYFSYATRNRVESSVKGFYKYFQIPGIQNLAGGLPHLSYFPYDTLEASVALPDRFNPDVSPPNGQVEVGSPNKLPASARLKVPKESSTSNLAKKIDLASALQYGTAEGYPPLHSFIRQFARENLHPNVPYEGGPEVALTCGSTDGFSKAIEAFTNVWQEGKDWIRERAGVLCEEFTYMNAIQTAKPRGLNIAPVAMDEYGMKVDGERGLADVLDNWDFSAGRRPHLMYTVTIGQNPSGAVIPLKRRQHIYNICKKYDIIIVEDDPYWHLQYPSASKLSAKYRGTQSSVNLGKCNYNAHGKPSGYPFLDSLVPSYLSIDTEGRVVRLDTFSKTIAPGCRLGWITAQPKVIERILRITETSTQQPSGFVQSMVAQLIMGNQDEGDRPKNSKSTMAPAWKTDGWVRWLEGLRGSYERRMQTMCTVLEEGKTVIEEEDMGAWEVVDKIQMYDFYFPRGGMFVWVSMCLETHPLWSQLPPEKLARGLWKHLTKKPFLCLVAPGSIFVPTKETKEGWRYLRLCFAPIEAEDVHTASTKFVNGFRSFWQIRDVHDIDDDDDDGFNVAIC